MNNDIVLYGFLRQNKNQFNAEQMKLYNLHSMLLSYGDYNGYLVCHKSHNWASLAYDDIPVHVHGGLTFGNNNVQWEEVKEEHRNEDYWVYGFDTMHFNSKRFKDKRLAQKELDQLMVQFFDEEVRRLRSR